VARTHFLLDPPRRATPVFLERSGILFIASG
jgi:hypothetical protein